MRQILIVEDDPITASIYQTKYAFAGFEVKTAHDGRSGCSDAGAFKPDLVHLDLQVPKVNGVEITRHIRGHPELKDVPIPEVPRNV